MTNQQLNDLFRPVACRLDEGNMRHLGIARTMRLARAYNRTRYGSREAWRRRLYRTQFDTLLEENGPSARPPLEMRDGWALDKSMSLPHLGRILEDADKIIAERAGIRRLAHGAYRTFFQDMWTAADAEKYPSFLDFATSSDVLSVVGRYLKTVPVLSSTVPAGIRLVESNAEFDDRPDQPHDSQLYHIDYYSVPNVYVLVLLQDTTAEQGPWTFLPRALSQKVRHALGYWKRGKPYRVSDAEVYSVADRREVVEFAYPRGTVLFIESSGCFHYGSRNAVKPRFQLMYGYTGICRTDFTELTMKPIEYPIPKGASRLRKLVLSRKPRPQR